MTHQLDVTTQLLGWLRRSDGAERLRDHVAGLEQRSLPSAPLPSEPPPEDGWLARDGYAILHEVAGPDLTSPLRRAVIELVGSGLPGVLVFMVDDLWTLTTHIERRLGELLGRPYILLDDGWAWSVAPGRGRGWPPHRGGGLVRFDRSAPELITAWIALGDVAADQACMHVVPLDEDPNYPTKLERVDAPLESVRALPISEGTALVWNANLLHWGGGCAARAATPRVSCSFSFGRADVAPPLELRRLAVPLDDPRLRLDFIADQIVRYADNEPGLATGILTWARAHRALRAAHSAP